MEHPLFSLEIHGFFDTKRAYTQIEAGYFMAFYKTPLGGVLNSAILMV